MSIKFIFAPIANRDIVFCMPSGDASVPLTIKAQLRTGRLNYSGKNDREIFHETCFGISDVKHADGLSALELDTGILGSQSPQAIRDSLVPPPVVQTAEDGSTTTTYPDAGICEWIVSAVALYVVREFPKALAGN